MSGAVAAARREAEEALAEYDRLWGAAHATNAYGRAVVGLASALRALLAAGPAAGERKEIERLRDSIEIEREGQRSMARALAEINRLSRLDVAIALAPGDEVAR